MHPLALEESEDFQDTDTLMSHTQSSSSSSTYCHCINTSSNTFYSTCISTLYIPAAFGLWSWPVLLNVVLGSGASASSILFSHYVAFYLTLVMAGLSLYLLIRDHPRGSGPIFLTAFALPLVMANPTINLMLDKGTIASDPTLNTLLNMVTWIGVLEMTFASGWNSSFDEWVVKKCSKCASTRS